MTPKFRNRALLCALCAIGLTAMVPHWLIRFIHRGPYQRADGVAVAMIVCYFVACVMWGMTALYVAKAKGYSSEEMVTPKAIVLHCLGFLVPVIPLAFVWYTLFALKNRSRTGNRAV